MTNYGHQFSRSGRAYVKMTIFASTSPASKAVQRDLGDGNDTVTISAGRGVPEVRLTFTSSEVGNGNARDSNTMANQDGGLAVRATG